VWFFCVPATNLKRFLIEVQNQEQATEEEAQAIIDSFNHFHRRGAGLNLETFFKFLFSDNNLPLSPSTGVSYKIKNQMFNILLSLLLFLTHVVFLVNLI
jgi:hypothetical protein